ncbi:uncharacterized protein DUF2220 [Heliophilum fasciatum]|uniref:Uncharacterized protein DUF2220 n=2 Tax=Heliophilum fasciatum TaxID=35700 RepID=A0A4R2RUK7_9FIRM|nr:uncharacterized protein DUF2220 [Heliophilum fasciatum]
MTLSGSPLGTAYDDEMDYRPRELIHAALGDLVRRGIVAVTWVRFQEGRRVDKVYLLLDEVEQAYRLTGRTSKADHLAMVQALAEKLLDHPFEWVRRWAAGIVQAAGERKSVGRLAEDGEQLELLVRVLQALPTVAPGTPKRVFSQAVLGDSKRFEQVVEKPLLALMRRECEEFERDEEYLDSIGLVDHPKLTLLAGPLQFAVGEVVTDVGALPGGVGLYGPTIEALAVRKLPATVVTVENLTSYEQLVAAVGAAQAGVVQPGVAQAVAALATKKNTVLIIYTGGFPHHGTLRLLQKLGQATPAGTRFWHWGDIDYGGIRIFEHIRHQALPDLQPLAMDVATYRRYAERGITVTEEYRRKLANLVEDGRFARWLSVLQALQMEGRRVEQESIDITEVMQRLMEKRTTAF